MGPSMALRQSARSHKLLTDMRALCWLCSELARLGKEKLLFAARDRLHGVRGRTALLSPTVLVEPLLLPGAMALLHQVGVGAATGRACVGVLVSDDDKRLPFPFVTAALCLVGRRDVLLVFVFSCNTGAALRPCDSIN